MSLIENLEINCLMQLIKLSLTSFYLVPKGKQTTNELDALCFFSDTCLQPMNIYVVSVQALGWATWSLLPCLDNVNVVLSTQPVHGKDPGINTTFYFPKESLSFESKTVSYVYVILGLWTSKRHICLKVVSFLKCTSHILFEYSIPQL